MAADEGQLRFATILSAKVSDLPWPDADERFHIEYRLDLFDDPEDYRDLSMSYSRTGAEWEACYSSPDFMASRIVGQKAIVTLDDDEEPTDIELIEPWSG